MMILPRDETEAFHATVNKTAADKGWDYPSLEVDELKVRIVRSYPYLGKKIQDSGATILHARERCALATASMRSFGKVYASNSVPERVKVQLCNGMYTIPQLTYGSPTQKEPDKSTMQTYSTMYLQTWKACLGKRVHKEGEFLHLTTDWILNEVNKPSWRVHLDALVLRLAVRVMKATCPMTPIFTAAMASVDFTVGSWWSVLAGATNRMRSSLRNEMELPSFDACSRTVWLQVVALDPAQWKRWIKGYIEVDKQERRRKLQEGIYVIPEQQAIDLVENSEYKCSTCEKVFGTYRGLLSHRRQSHKVESALATRVGSHACAACKGEYGSRKDHLMHLNNNLRCALYTMVHCEQLTDAELHAARAIKNVLRTAPPKRGPKRQVDGGMPVSRTIDLLELNVSEDGDEKYEVSRCRVKPPDPVADFF
eukprot:3856022-Amphidinium_carterae.1